MPIPRMLTGRTARPGRRRAGPVWLLAGCLILAAAGCRSGSVARVNRPAPVVATEQPTPEEAAWRHRYRKNRPTPPETYRVFPKPPRNNGFGEFNEDLHRGLDSQPPLPALPGDIAAMAPPAYVPDAPSPALARAGGGHAPVAPPGIMADGHFYPIEQLVYGGDQPDIDKPERYRLMPKDVITVTVRDHPELSGQLEIQPDGTVRLPSVHDLARLRGLTVEEASEELRRALAVYVRGDCVVRVQANRARGGYYFVFGDVLQPGRFPMGMEPVKLSDAVLAANWEANPGRRDLDGDELGPSFPAASPRGKYIAPSTADLARVMLITPHRSQPARSVHDVRSAMLGVTSQDPVIRPGQIVVVPSLDPSRNSNLPFARTPTGPVPAPAASYPGTDAPARLPDVRPDPQVDVPTADSWSVSAVDANMATAFDGNLNTGTVGTMRRARILAPTPEPEPPVPDYLPAAGNGPGTWNKGR